MTKLPRPGDKPMVEVCGPVQINTDEELLHRRHKSDEQHSGDAGSHRSTFLAEHVRGALRAYHTTC